METAFERDPENGCKGLRADAARNRQAILDAAAGMFAEHGTQLTLEQIAKAAGIGVGTIYRRFPTLDALIQELFGERIRWWAAHVSELAELALTSPWEAFEKYVLALADADGSDVAFAQILADPTHAETRFHDDYTRSLAGAELLLTRAIESGVVRDDLENSDLLHVQAALLGIVQNSRTGNSRSTTRFARILLDAFRPTTER